MVRTFERYLSDIGRHPLLAPDEEADLARRAGAGDEAARRRLVTANLRFVVSIARHYRGRDVPFVDLVNEGNLGLLEAADRYDPGRGVRFISYAHFWVRRAMSQAISAAEVRRSADERPWRRISLDERPPGSPSALAELLPDEGSPSVEARILHESLRGALEACLSDLPARERDVVRAYFGLGPDGARNLGEIAEDLGVSRERARQLKERGLARLRAAAARHGLRAFADGGPPAGRRSPRRVGASLPD